MILFMATSAMMLTGCSVEIGATNVTARAASSTEIQSDAEASSYTPDGGAWVLLSALIAKEDVSRVSRWEVYPHVYVIDCSTGRDTNIGTEPQIDGVRFADANAVHAYLRDHSAKQVYEMQSLVFARKGDFRTPQCMQFRGGSYTGQKIVEKRIPIRANRPLP